MCIIFGDSEGGASNVLIQSDSGEKELLKKSPIYRILARYAIFG